MLHSKELQSTVFWGNFKVAEDLYENKHVLVEAIS